MSSKAPFLQAAIAGALLPLLLSTAFGAETVPPAEDVRAEDVRWSLSGEARFRPEWRDDADLDEAVDDDRREGLMRLRLAVSVSIREDTRIFVQAQDSRAAGEETSTASNEKNLDLHQGYLEIRKTGIEGLAVTLGRQELRYGDDRMIGAFGWNNVGRSFDGVKLRYHSDPVTVDALLARITSRVSAGATSGSDLYGLYAQRAHRDGVEHEAYWLAYADSLAAPGEAGPPGDTRVHALGLRIKDRWGRLDLTAEAAVERGQLHGDDLSALAAAVQAGLTWGERAKVRIFAGYDHATGDGDPTDGKQGEFFNFFPTNHPHYGYADYEGWRNIESPWAGVSLGSGRHFWQIKGHRFALESARGPWKDAGGAVLGFDPGGASGTNVGTEVDLTWRLQWREKTVIEAGYSRLEPGRFARLTRGDDPSDWAYLMLTVGF